MEEAVARARKPHLGVDPFRLPEAPLVKVAQAEPSQVREYVEGVMEYADAVCCSVEELAGVVRRLCGVS